MQKGEENDFGGLATFWSDTFTMVYCDTGSLLGQENSKMNSNLS